MKIRLALAFCLLGSITEALARDVASTVAREWARSLVTLDITHNQPDFLQPWTSRPQTLQKAGVVVREREILTTADGLEHRTLVRVQKGGRGEWFAAQVRWIDYPANLALLTSTNEIFWKGLRPAALASGAERDGNLQLIRWRAGNLEVRRAEFNRFTVSNPSVSDAAHVLLEVNCEIDGAGWAELVVSGHKAAGIVLARTGNLCRVLPAPFVTSILNTEAKGPFPGLGYFDFTWQPAENPETLRYLHLPPDRDGVVVIDVPHRPGATPVLQPRDILLRVDGFDVDQEGDYVDPIYGHLMLENLSTRNKWAGDRVNLKIWRDGRETNLVYTLPKIEGAARLVPDSPYDRDPEYLVAGGFVFQPLTKDFLRSWGQDWERRAPFRLAYFRNEEPSPERPAVIVLSQVLPDSFNLGYQEVRHIVLERVNGQKISSLRDLQSALASSRDGFYMLEFLKGETLQRIVLDAAQLDAATRRVLQRYGIDKTAVILPPS
jgi:hypothetical protein